MDRKAFINRHIQLATKVAHSGQHDQYRVGAVLVRKGKIISVGANSSKSHPLMTFKTIHAETQALIGVRYMDLAGSIIFVSRINKNSKIGMAKPCNMCENLLRQYNIKKIYYTTSGSIEEFKLS